MVKLADIKDQEYDLVVSLGSNCQVTHQIKRAGLRTFSGPLDWFVFGDIHDLNKAIANKFNDFMQLENLILQGRHDFTFLVTDIKYNCLSVHDFPLTAEDDEWLSSYPEFNSKLKHRIDTFFQKIKESKSILFVRNGIDYEGVEELKNILSNCTNGNFKILALNYVEEYSRPLEKYIDITNICYVEIENFKERWEGRDEDWDYLLSGIKLARSNELI